MPAPLNDGDREALDGLRGLAALIVVASHASNLGLHLIPGWSLSGIGKSGVYLFFVLSAFLLTQQWLSATREQVHSVRYGIGYLIRRFARIYPLYLAILLTGWALGPKGLGVPMDGAAVWTHLTLREGRDVYWSIPVEFLFYLCIPPLALVLRYVTGPMGWLVTGGVLIGAATVIFPADASPLNSINLGYYLPIFFAGSLAAWWQVRSSSKPPALAVTAHRISFADGGAVLVLLLSVPSVLALAGLNGSLELLHREFLLWGVAWAILLTGVVRGWLPLWRHVLRLRGLRACGHWCFGIYLLHMPSLLLMNKLGVSGTVGGWLGLALALLLAAVAHRLIEQPFIRWGARAVR